MNTLERALLVFCAAHISSLMFGGSEIECAIIGLTAAASVFAFELLRKHNDRK